MTNDKTIEKTREALEEHIQLIIRKGGNMTPPDIEILTKDICALEALKRIECIDEENYFGNSYRRGRSQTTGRYVSRDAYRSDGSSQRYYDGNSNNGGYSGHSINDRMIDQLEHMFDQAQTEHERQTVREWINRIRAN